jgi:hypothetical protein
MSVDHLRNALKAGDDAAFFRYACLHLGDGDAEAGRAEIEKVYVLAVKALMESPPTDYATVRAFVADCDQATLAHLFLYTHLQLARNSGDWIHDGEL